MEILEDVKKFKSLFEEMHNLCLKNNWGDPFSYSRSKEIHMCGILNHKICETFSGPDAYDEDGPCEYKSTINKNIQAKYSGISVFSKWEDQEKYLQEDKIKKYKNHYIARYNGCVVEELYKLSGDDIYKILLPKLKKQFYSQSKSKDPRLSATLNKKEIYEYGRKII